VYRIIVVIGVSLFVFNYITNILFGLFDGNRISIQIPILILYFGYFNGSFVLSSFLMLSQALALVSNTV